MIRQSVPLRRIKIREAIHCGETDPTKNESAIAKREENKWFGFVEICEQTKQEERV